MRAVQSPSAYLLTWTCYGTWLHGDPRGSVDADHRVPRTAYLPADPRRQQRAAGGLRSPKAELSAVARQVVHKAILDHCAFRGWEVLALNVRSNHVHAVIACGDLAPKTALSQLRAWSTRRLRAAGLFTIDQKVWTEHGSTRYLWDDAAVHNAVDYVTEGQGPDLPAD